MVKGLRDTSGNMLVLGLDGKHLHLFGLHTALHTRGLGLTSCYIGTTTGVLNLVRRQMLLVYSSSRCCGALRTATTSSGPTPTAGHQTSTASCSSTSRFSRPGTVFPCCIDIHHFSIPRPNEVSQSNVSPQDAVDYYRKYMLPMAAKGFKLGMAAVTNAPSGLEWIQQFVKLCPDCHFDFIPIHWYATDTQNFQDYLVSLVCYAFVCWYNTNLKTGPFKQKSFNAAFPDKEM